MRPRPYWQRTRSSRARYEASLSNFSGQDFGILLEPDSVFVQLQEKSAQPSVHNTTADNTLGVSGVETDELREELVRTRRVAGDLAEQVARLEAKAEETNALEAELEARHKQLKAKESEMQVVRQQQECTSAALHNLQATSYTQYPQYLNSAVMKPEPSMVCPEL